MQEVTFVAMPGIGPGLLPPRTGWVADLIMAIPYLVVDEIPPRQVINDVLTRGFDDAGMSGGCIWEPLELGEAEYGELVQELQRLGMRPVHGRDPGGNRFEVPAVPPSVQTRAEWSVWRGQRRGSMTSERARDFLEHEQRLHPPHDRYQRWLDRLPVGEIYLSQLRAHYPDWEERPDDALGLPPALVQMLRRLQRTHDRWLHRDPQVPYPESIPDDLRSIEDAESIRKEIREYIDKVGLHRWPYG